MNEKWQRELNVHISHNKYSEAQTNGAFLSGKTPAKMLELVSHLAFLFVSL